MISALPNLLSFFRFLLAWILVYFILNHQYGFAFMTVALAGVSDFLDGYLARKFSKTTPLGMFLDPIADKFFFLCLFLSLYFVGLIPTWIVVLFLARDIMIVSGWAYLFKNQPLNSMRQMTPSFVSKVNTVLQFIYPIFVLLNQVASDIIPFIFLESFIMLGAAVTTVTSGIIYVLRFRDYIK